MKSSTRFRERLRSVMLTVGFALLWSSRTMFTPLGLPPVRSNSSEMTLRVLTTRLSSMPLKFTFGSTMVFSFASKGDGPVPAASLAGFGSMTPGRCHALSTSPIIWLLVRARAGPPVLLSLAIRFRKYAASALPGSIFSTCRNVSAAAADSPARYWLRARATRPEISLVVGGVGAIAGSSVLGVATSGA